MALRAQTSETSDYLSTNMPLGAGTLPYIGIDDWFADLAPEVAELDVEGCCSYPDIDQPTEISPHCDVDRDPNSAIEKAEEGVRELKSNLEGKQSEVQAQFQSLRRKLQNGLLTKGRPLREEDMDAMSLCLKQLEMAEDPSKIIIIATRVSTLLRKIKKLESIPREDKLRIKKRAAALYERFNAILNPSDQAADSLTSQPSTQVASQDPVADSQPSEPPSQAALPTSIVDLTESSDSEESPQPTSGHGFGGRKIQTATLTPYGGLTSGNTNTDDDSRTDTVLNARKRKRTSSAESLPTTESSTTGCSPPRLGESPNSVVTAAASPLDKKQTRRRRKQKTTFQSYMHTESLWISRSRKRVEQLLKLNAEGIELDGKKRKLNAMMTKLENRKRGLDKATRRLGKEMGNLDDQTRDLNEREGNELMDFKEDVRNWIDEDHKVTSEWES